MNTYSGKNKEFSRGGVLCGATCSGMTIIELLMAMMIIVIIVVAVVPQFRSIRMGWATSREKSELVENCQALLDHITLNLMKARRTTLVSDANNTDGFIEFMDNNSVIYRYQIGDDNYVQYGPLGNLSNVAGPVNGLIFTCYGSENLGTSTTDTDIIRSIKVEATFSNPSGGRDMTMTSWAYLRTNYLSAEIILSEEYEFDTSKCQTPSLAEIDNEHYLCAYGGGWNRGTAVVLIPRYISDAWQITKGATFVFDNAYGRIPELCQIDATNYLCAYRGPDSDGWAVVLNVNTGTWSVTKDTPFEFAPATGLPIPEETSGDADTSYRPGLAKINASNFLCAYMGQDSDGWVVILNVNPGTHAITTNGTPFEFDIAEGRAPALAQIDATHYLCVYTGPNEDGWAVVIEVDMGTWAITKHTPFEFDADRGDRPDLAKIDDEHYLCAYSGPDGHGWVVVLNVDPATWEVSKNTPYEFDNKRGQVPELQKIDLLNYVCSYEGEPVDPNLGELSDSAITVLFSINMASWTIYTNTSPKKYSYEGDAPDIAVIDDHTFFSAYDGYLWHGWCTVLEVDLAIKP